MVRISAFSFFGISGGRSAFHYEALNTRRLQLAGVLRSVCGIMRSRLLLPAATGLAIAACSQNADRAADTTVAKDRPRDTMQAQSPPALSVSPFGIGPIRAGMSVAEASAASGGALAFAPGADTTACGYLIWPGGPSGVQVMVEHAKIARVDVDSGTVATTEGIGIGATEQDVLQRYQSRVAVTPSKYTKGHYLTVTPVSSADSAFRIVFETENNQVIRYRAGRRPAVEYVERCG
jgi:hypothetical protein